MIRWICLLLLVVTVIGVTVAGAKGASAQADGFVLEDMPIVLPANATEVEKTAAKELQHYLREITGGASSIITEAVPVESAIYLGATKFAEASNVTYTDKNGQGEGWAIKAVGNSLVITGGAKRGTLYGVYHVLEDELGVRWWNAWEEYVPSMDDAVVPFDIDRSGEPAFGYRDIYSNELIYGLNYTRNRVNGWASNAPVAYGGEIDFGLPYHVHTFNRYFPPFYKAPVNDDEAYWLDAINPDHTDWFEEHPDWYSYDKVRGERIGASQMCLANEELIEVFAEKVCIAIDLSYEKADKAGKERPLYYSVTPNDTDGHCECDDCERILAESGETGRLLRFINAIAEKVEKVHPEVYIETLSYAKYLDVPLDDTKPRHNVVMRLCSSDADALHDWSHPNNKMVRDRFADWAAILEPYQMILWDYNLNYAQNGVFPSYFRVGPDYRYFYELGGTGAFVEQENINESEFWDMKHWMLMKLMEDPYQDEYALAWDFVSGYYGEAAAEYIYDYLLFWEAEAADHYEITDFSDDIMDAEWITIESVLKGNQYFEDALAALEADDTLTDEERELFMNRVNVVRGGLDRLMLFNYYDYVDEMAEKGEVFPLRKQDIGKRMIGSLQWLFDMELEEDYTGVQSVNNRGHYGGSGLLTTYQAYLTEEDEMTGELIAQPEIPQQIFDDHPGLDAAHVLEYYYPNMYCAAAEGNRNVQIVKNGASYPGGTAVLWDQNEIFKNAASSSIGPDYFTFSETKAMGGPGKLYLNDPIVNDGEWHLYRAEDVVVLSPSNSRVGFFAETLRFEVGLLSHLSNKKVDVYMNMKVEGDPSGEDPRNYAKIYMDAVYIVEPCDSYNVQYTSETPATCAAPATKTGMCPACGQQTTTEVDGTQLPHDIIGGYTWDADKKVYKATCSLCGEVEFDFLGELPEELLQELIASGIDLNKVHDFGLGQFDVPEKWAGQSFVEDSDSLVGKAVRWDAADCTYYGYYIINDARPMALYCGYNIDTIKKDDIINDGEYHLYALKDLVVYNSAADHKLKFFDESLRVDFADFEYLKGAATDVYFTMKVIGDTDFDENSTEHPIYYIDRVIMVEKCTKHVADSYTFDAATNTYEGTCINCGKPVSHAFMAELPQEILDALAETDSDLAHVYEYGVEDFFTGAESGEYRKVVEDPASAVGEALKYDPTKTSAAARHEYFVFSADKPFTMNHQMWENSVKPLTGVSPKVMNANSGDGQYHLYKMSGILAHPNLNYLWAFDWNVQNKFSDIQKKLEGLNVDLYISMKIEGDVTYTADLDLTKIPKYWIDRMIVVDKCGNHIPNHEREVLSQPTCYQGYTEAGTCGLCGKYSEVEDESTRLPHDFGPYVTNADGSKTASCRNDGCTETKTLKPKGELPQVILDDLAAKGLGLEHAHDYTADQFTMLLNWFEVENDADSLVGYAAKADAWKDGSRFNPNDLIMEANEKWDLSIRMTDDSLSTIGTLTYDMLKPNENKGYVVYKFDDYKIPEGAFKSLQMFSWPVYGSAAMVENNVMVNDLAALKGKTVDVYLSLKVEGALTNWSAGGGPVWYVDRMVFVDSCEDYEIEYKDSGKGDCASGTELVGACPVCDKRHVKSGTGNHKFGTYYRSEKDRFEYIAECEYGCGTTDSKFDPRLEMEDLFPEELPQSVRNHALFTYSCRDFTYSYETGYRWDHDLNRPVVVRDYYDMKTDLGKTVMLMNEQGGLSCVFWAQGNYPLQILGGFSGAQMIANANDGEYHLYELKGVRPITLPAYNYMYFFGDWDVQIHMIDEDLEPYRDQVMDFYLYMKVEGDPTGGSGINNMPKYYIDQFIVAQTCQTDETWTVTKEATCTETGEMVGNCSVCGLENSVVTTPMKDHNVPEGVPYSQPTCRDDAVVRGKCADCGQVEYMTLYNTTLDHVFTNYVKVEDGSGREVAWCDHGCGARHYRDSFNTGSNLDIPEGVQQFLPILGGAAGAPSFSFSDIKESDWYFESVKEAWSNKLINGVTATEFRPNETLTVAQAVKLASAYHEMNYTGDVTLENGSGNWYSSYVDYAVENGIIDRGYASKSTAEMNKAIDRSEFVSIFVKAMDEGSLVGYNEVADNAIPDVKADDENAEAIYKFYRAGILTGSDGKGTFNPTSSIKRSEVAAILSRMYNENVRQAITLK